MGIRRKRPLFSLAIAATSLLASACGGSSDGEPTFSKSYGTASPDLAAAAIRLEDRSYAIVGTNTLGRDKPGAVWVSHVDNAGNPISDYLLGPSSSSVLGDSSESVDVVSPTPDGGRVHAGTLEAEVGTTGDGDLTFREDFMVRRFAADGTEVWQRQIDTGGWPNHALVAPAGGVAEIREVEVLEVLPLTDGGLILVGLTEADLDPLDDDDDRTVYHGVRSLVLLGLGPDGERRWFRRLTDGVLERFEQGYPTVGPGYGQSSGSSARSSFAMTAAADGSAVLVYRYKRTWQRTPDGRTYDHTGHYRVQRVATDGRVLWSHEFQVEGSGLRDLSVASVRVPDAGGTYGPADDGALVQIKDAMYLLDAAGERRWRLRLVDTSDGDEPRRYARNGYGRVLGQHCRAGAADECYYLTSRILREETVQTVFWIDGDGQVAGEISGVRVYPGNKPYIDTTNEYDLVEPRTTPAGIDLLFARNPDYREDGPPPDSGLLAHVVRDASGFSLDSIRPLERGKDPLRFVPGDGYLGVSSPNGDLVHFAPDGSVRSTWHSGRDLYSLGHAVGAQGDDLWLVSASDDLRNLALPEGIDPFRTEMTFLSRLAPAGADWQLDGTAAWRRALPGIAYRRPYYSNPLNRASCYGSPAVRVTEGGDTLVAGRLLLSGVEAEVEGSALGFYAVDGDGNQRWSALAHGFEGACGTVVDRSTNGTETLTLMAVTPAAAPRDDGRSWVVMQSWTERRTRRIYQDGDGAGPTTRVPTSNELAPRSRIAVLGLDADGEATTSGVFETSPGFAGLDIVTAPDGGILGVAGPNPTASPIDTLFELIRFRADGSPAEYRRYRYGLGRKGAAEHHVTAMADGGYAIAFSARGIASQERRRDSDEGPLYDVPYGARNVTVVRLDESLRIEWARVYGGFADESATGIEALPDGGLLVSGASSSFGVRADGWLLRLDPEGRVTEGCQALLASFGPEVFPYDPLPVPAPADGASLQWIRDALPPIQPAPLPPARDISEEMTVAAQCRGAVPGDDERTTADEDLATLTVNQAGEGTGVVTSIPSGIVCGTAGNEVCATQFNVDSLVRLVVDPASRVDFGGWGPGCEVMDGPECQVRMDEDRSIDVYFGSNAPNFSTLRVTLSGGGSGSVVSNPAGVDCPDDCQSAFPVSQRVELMVFPDADSRFNGFSGDPDCDDGDIFMTGDRTCDARFGLLSAADPDEVVAVITVDDATPVVDQAVTFDGGGSYVRDPNDGSRFPDLITRYEWDFEDDGEVDVSGPPEAAARVQHSYADPGFYDARLRVTGESSQDGSTITGENITTIQVGEDNPSGPGPFVLTVRQNGTNRGTVEVDPAGPALINTDQPPFTECTDQQCSQNYYAGTQVTLTAVATVIGDITGERDLFVRWEGASCPVAGSTNATETITMDNNALCAAFFREVRELTVRVSGDGSVTTTPPEIVDCTDDCSAFFDARTVVTMTPTPGPGQRFSGWAADNDCEDGEVTMFADRLCIAQFDPLGATVTLTVDVDGGPQDRVRTGDGRIDCPGTCEADYAPGTSVNIFAEPGPGASFGGWTQDCAIYQTQTGINLTLDSDTLCGAFFE